MKPKYNIIFLDMDGVINSDDYVKRWKKKMNFYNLTDNDKRTEWEKFRKEHSIDGEGFGFIVPELRDKVNRILKEVENAKVVWSSSWRFYVKDSKIFVEGLYNQCGFEKDSFLSYTPITLSLYERNLEIIHWIEIFSNSSEFEFDKFVVIDDLDEARIPDNYFKKLKNIFVQTSPRTGITDFDVEKVIDFFKEK